MLACAPLNIWVVNALKSSLESLNTIESQRTSAPRELYWYSWINMQWPSSISFNFHGRAKYPSKNLSLALIISKSSIISNFVFIWDS